MEKNLTSLLNDAKGILKNTALTHEQIVNNLAGLPGAYASEDTFVLTEEFKELREEGLLCPIGEGYMPIAPRYILPDYEVLMKNGCKFLRLDPPKDLYEACETLKIFYRYVPSVTNYPVFLGYADSLLEPFADTVSEEEGRAIIKSFMFFLSRSIPDSFAHMNIGPVETRIGNYIIEADMELREAIPSVTMIYDKEKTSDAFLKKALECSQLCAKPSISNHDAYKKTINYPYGIASCYNALPLGGGAYSLSRVMVSKIADKVKNREEFFNLLPKAVYELCNFMETKIDFINNETNFFTSSFLVKEGFVKKENFTSMVGIVGMNECVNTLLKKEGIDGQYGKCEEADELTHMILAKLNEHINEFNSKYCDVVGNHFQLHAQVGIDTDTGISPGMRIAIGSEPDLYTHLKHECKFQKYFPSGVGEIFPFDETAKNNIEGIMDIVKGSFASGMQYFSSYSDDCDVIRVTGYLVKKSDMEKLAKGEAVTQANATWGLNATRNLGVLNRKVETLDESSN